MIRLEIVFTSSRPSTGLLQSVTPGAVKPLSWRQPRTVEETEQWPVRVVKRIIPYRSQGVIR